MRSRGLAAGAIAALVTACAQHILPNPSAGAPSASRDSIEVSLFLIGDAGEPAPGGEPVLEALGRQLREAPERSIVVFLGDNAYPLGVPDTSDETYAEARRRLLDQVSAVRHAGARGFLVPGNHDWRRGRPGGLASVQRADRLVDSAGADLVVQLPDGGCPGPVVRDVSSHVRLVLLDTQWWLQEEERPEGAAAGCVEGMAAAYDSLRSVFRTAGGRHVIVAGHHALESGGEHGGFFEWKDHVFPLRHLQSWLWLPLPVIGSAYPISRMAGITDQDFSSDRYGALRDSLRSVFSAGAPLVYAAGHDHSLQVIETPHARYQLVSGAGIYGHLDPVHSTDGTTVAISESGFMRLDVGRDGTVRLGVHVVDKGSNSKEVYAQWLTR